MGMSQKSLPESLFQMIYVQIINGITIQVDNRHAINWYGFKHRPVLHMAGSFFNQISD
jgi:hypothetical protein